KRDPREAVAISGWSEGAARRRRGSGTSGGRSWLADGEGAGIDGGHERAAVVYGDVLPARAHPQPHRGDVTVGRQHVEVDASRPAAHGVQGMDESLLASAVERVGPPAVRAHR